MRTSNATFVGERISFKHSQIVADAIRNKSLAKAKSLLTDVLAEKRTIGGMVFPKSSKAFLTLLNSAEANAKQKNIDTEKMFVKVAKADRAAKYIRGRSLAKYRGQRAKVTHISVILEVR